MSWNYVCGKCGAVLITNTSVDLQTLRHDKDGCRDSGFLNRVDKGVLQIMKDVDDKFGKTLERELFSVHEPRY